MIRGQAGQSIGAQMVFRTTGADFTGAVTVYITVDAGTQAIGSVGGGLCTAEGNGYYTYRPSQSETDGDIIAFTFTGVDALTQTVQVATVTITTQMVLAGTSAANAVTVSDLITAALKRVNAIQANEVPSADDLQDAFLRLNDLMESWQTERLTIPYFNRTTWTLTSTKGTLANPYTVGSGGDVDVLKPVFIQDGYLRFQDTSLSPTIEYPMAVLTDHAWARIPQKDLTSTYPVAAYYNPTTTGYLGSLYLYMVPTSSTLQGVLYSPAQVAAFGATSDVIVLPPGYLRFIRDNLAVELAPEWRDGLPADPQLVASAREAKANIKRANIRMDDMSVGWGIGVYDINSDRNLWFSR